MIYILDEGIPSSQLEDQLKKTQPLTKEQVVDLIISKIDGQDAIDFNAFTQKYETLNFKHKNNEKKHKMYHKDLADLENLNQFRGTWIDPEELKSDLINDLTSFHIVNEKTVLYNYQIQDWIKTATSWIVLHKKKEYLDQALGNLQNSFNINIDSPEKTAVNTSGEPKQNIGSAPDEEPVNKVKEKRVPEKWYALLHIILISLNKKDAIDDLSDMKGIKALGKFQYKLEGTGRCFYNEIKNIKSSTPSVYISNLSKKERKKMKPLLIDISGNDADVILYVKNLPN